jgi:hypothetical protein
MAKSAPFSLRLSDETDRLVTAEAKRTKRSKDSVVEALAEEALKARTVPGIAFRGDDYNHRAWLTGTSLDVWQVIEGVQGLQRESRSGSHGDRHQPMRAADRAQLLQTLSAGD